MCPTDGFPALISMIRGATEPKAAGRYRSGTARFEHRNCRTAVPAVPLPGRAARSSAALPSFQRTGPAQTLPLRCFQTSHGCLEAESGFFFILPRKSHGCSWPESRSAGNAGPGLGAPPAGDAGTGLCATPAGQSRCRPAPHTRAGSRPSRRAAGTAGAGLSRQKWDFRARRRAGAAPRAAGVTASG